MKCTEEKVTKTRWEIIKAPTLILQVESFYWFWIVSYILSFLGLLLDLLNGKISYSINNGIIYNTCLAVIIPLLLDFFLSFVSGNRREAKEEFSVYKSWVMSICVVMLVLLALLYGSEMKSSISLQIICFFVVLILSFYTFLVTKMSTHASFLKDYKDKLYCEVESDKMSSTNRKSKKLKKTTAADGTEVKL